MISFLDPVLSLAKINEIRTQSWMIHTIVSNMYGFNNPIQKDGDTLADARRRRNARKNK